MGAIAKALPKLAEAFIINPVGTLILLIGGIILVVALGLFLWSRTEDYADWATARNLKKKYGVKK